MDSPISRAEHEEFRRRIEEENKRQDKRIEILEGDTRRLEGLSSSIEKLALNMENMLKEQVKQGQHLEILESRDGEKWRKIVSDAIKTIIGIIIGFLFTRLGL